MEAMERLLSGVQFPLFSKVYENKQGTLASLAKISDIMQQIKASGFTDKAGPLLEKMDNSAPGSKDYQDAHTAYTNLKASCLPTILLSTRCLDSSKSTPKEEYIKGYTGFICFDFDHISAPETQLEKCLQIGGVFGAVSASGRGFWVALATKNWRPTDIDDYKRGYSYLAGGLIRETGLQLAADPACKNINRHRFLSPYELHINNNAKFWEVDSKSSYGNKPAPSPIEKKEAAPVSLLERLAKAQQGERHAAALGVSKQLAAKGYTVERITQELKATWPDYAPSDEQEITSLASSAVEKYAPKWKECLCFSGDSLIIFDTLGEAKRALKERLKSTYLRVSKDLTTPNNREAIKETWIDKSQGRLYTPLETEKLRKQISYYYDENRKVKKITVDELEKEESINLIPWVYLIKDWDLKPGASGPGYQLKYWGGVPSKGFYYNERPLTTLEILQEEGGPRAAIDENIKNQFKIWLYTRFKNPKELAYYCKWVLTAAKGGRNKTGIFFEGPTGTGKSTLTEIATYLVGDKASLSDNSRQSSSSFDTLGHEYRLTVYDEKSPKGASADSDSFFKRLITADVLSVTLKHKDPVERKDFTNVIAAANFMESLGEIQGEDRRWTTLYIGDSLKEKPKDEKYPQYIQRLKDKNLDFLADCFNVFEEIVISYELQHGEIDTTRPLETTLKGVMEYQNLINQNSTFKAAVNALSDAPDGKLSESELISAIKKKENRERAGKETYTDDSIRIALKSASCRRFIRQGKNTTKNGVQYRPYCFTDEALAIKEAIKQLDNDEEQEPQEGQEIASQDTPVAARPLPFTTDFLLKRGIKQKETTPQATTPKTTGALINFNDFLDDDFDR